MIQRWLQSWRQTTIANKFIAWASCVVALATVIYAVIAICQWRALLASNEINRESLQSVQRAFVSYRDVGAARVRSDPTKGSPHIWQFNPTIENSGTTPAIAAIQQFNIKDGLPDEPTEEMFRGDIANNSTATTISPRALQGVGRQNIDEVRIFGKELTENLDNFSTATIQPGIFLWGWVVYRDVFPNTRPHVMEYCQRLRQADFFPYNPVPKIGFVYVNCKEHNCTDNECKDYDEIVKTASYIGKR